jgi:hypothetical protein
LTRSQEPEALDALPGGVGVDDVARQDLGEDGLRDQHLRQASAVDSSAPARSAGMPAVKTQRRPLRVVIAPSWFFAKSAPRLN